MSDSPPLLENRDATATDTLEVPSILQSLKAPWLLFRPRRGAVILMRTSPWRFLLSQVPGALLLLGTILLLLVARYRFVVNPFMNDVKERSYSESVRYVLMGPGLIEFGVFGITAMFGMTAALVLGGLLLAPSTFSGGRLWSEISRGVRAAAASWGVALLWLVLIMGFQVAVTSILDDNSRESVMFYMAIYQIVNAILPCAVAITLSLAANAVADAGPMPALPPMCERCGYDLSHTPLNTRCSECGMPTDSSLGAATKRRGGAWQRQQTLMNWVGTTLSVLVSPGDFYKRLKLRDGRRGALTFAATHYVAAGLLASLWIPIFASGMGVMEKKILLIAVPLGFVVPLAGWFMVRLGASIVTIGNIVTRSIVDPRSPRQALVFETSFIWMYCAVNGMLVSSFIAAEDWLSTMIGTRSVRWLGGLPPELLLLAASNCFLFAVQLWRFQTALRNTRWANS